MPKKVAYECDACIQKKENAIPELFSEEGGIRLHFSISRATRLYKYS